MSTSIHSRSIILSRTVDPCPYFNSTKAPQPQPSSTRKPFHSPTPSRPRPLPVLLRFDDARRHEDGHGGGGGGGGAPVEDALRAQRAAAHDPPAAGGRGPAAGVGGGGGVHAARRVHGAHVLRLAHLHAGLLPHALGPRPRLRLPLRRLPHQPLLRDREGRPLLARRVLLLLLLGPQGGLHMAYISQASIHVDAKSNTEWAPHGDV